MGRENVRGKEIWSKRLGRVQMSQWELKGKQRQGTEGEGSGDTEPADDLEIKSSPPQGIMFCYYRSGCCDGPPHTESKPLTHLTKTAHSPCVWHRSKHVKNINQFHPHSSPWGRNCCYSHFTDGKIEARRGHVAGVWRTWGPSVCASNSYAVPPLSSFSSIQYILVEHLSTYLWNSLPAVVRAAPLCRMF